MPKIDDLNIEAPPRLKFSKKKHRKHKDIKIRCDNLWAQIVKLKAGMKSEWSGKTENLHAHHLVGKSNYRLRYEIENGICLTGGEHKFIAHNPDRYETFRETVKRIRGRNIFDRLNQLRGNNKSDIRAVELYLKCEFNKLKES